MLESEKLQIMTGKKVYKPSEMLIKRGNTQRINSAIEGVLGLPDKDRKMTASELENKVCQHIGVPQSVSCAHQAGRNEWME
jgi:hypothetical protein